MITEHPDAMVPPRLATATHALTAAPHEPGYPDCFGCGHALPHGLQVRVVSAKPDELVATVCLRNMHQGEREVAHGGVVAAILDEVISLAMWRALDRKYVTRKLDIDFLAPVPIGKEVELRARCTRVHGRKAYGEATALLGGSVLANAAGLFIQVRSGLGGSRPGICGLRVPRDEKRP